MSPTPPFPLRPRLAEHALARRHLVDGVERVVIHDARRGDLSTLEPRAWEIVSGADGTRDLDGICLAAARAGAFHRRSEVRFVLEALHAAGLLADGIAEAPPAGDAGEARPLAVLPGFALHCDASGACCGVYGTVRFTDEEARRARATLPTPLHHPADARLFMPDHGSDVRGGALAVTMVDGRCAFLGEAGACRLHAAAGAGAKPVGCRSFPATFVDDGHEVRVSVACECACVLASAGLPGGEPMVAAGARCVGDLRLTTPPSVLPDRIHITETATAARADFVAWSDAVRAALSGDGPTDVPSFFWALAAGVEAGALDLGGLDDALCAVRPWAPGGLGAWTAALRTRAAAKRVASEVWRSPNDRVRRMAGWIDAAARALDDGAADAPLAAPGAPELARDEAFYLRAVLFGHHLAGAQPLATALRDRALRCLLARHVRVPSGEPESAQRHPLAAVEALMRGQGMDAYVALVAR
ncbi:MAG: YkgJ family cysteine cluster protein [Polyangiaceae bacterium]